MTYAYYVLLIIDALLGLSLLFLKRLGANMYPIALAVLIGSIEEITGYYFAIRFKYSLNVNFFFNPFEYACFAWFFFLNIDYKYFKKAIKASIILCFSFIAGYFYFFTKLASFPAKILLDYFVVTKAVLLSLWSIVYVINIFNQISNYKRLNVFVLLVSAAILFYSCFSIIFHLSEIYLINYSEQHRVPLNVLLSSKNIARMYASKQYAAVFPLLLLTNILLYLCIFVALIKSAVTSKKAFI